MRPAALLLPCLFVLAACDRSAPEDIPTKPQPILSGSVSDAMLQTDQLKAEAPLAAPEASGEPNLDGIEGLAPAGSIERPADPASRPRPAASGRPGAEADGAAPAKATPAPKAPPAKAPPQDAPAAPPAATPR